MGVRGIRYCVAYNVHLDILHDTVRDYLEGILRGLPSRQRRMLAPGAVLVWLRRWTAWVGPGVIGARVRGHGVVYPGSLVACVGGHGLTASGHGGVGFLHLSVAIWLKPYQARLHCSELAGLPFTLRNSFVVAQRGFLERQCQGPLGTMGGFNTKCCSRW